MSTISPLESWQLSRPLSRRLADLRRTKKGPTLVIIGSLHGNEPAGLLALDRVLTVLEQEEKDPLQRGRVIGVSGNIRASLQQQRYVERDLNRGWSRQRVEELRARGPGNAEDHEMLELAQALEEIAEQAHDDLYFLDLHTTSGESPPFCTSTLDQPSLHLAESALAPNVLGIDDHLEGTLFEFLRQHRYHGLIFESGQHLSPASIAHAEAAIWLVLEALGLLRGRGAMAVHLRHHLDALEFQLSAATAEFPRLSRIAYRHAIAPGEGFEMKHGFHSFQLVPKGTELAVHRGQPVLAPIGGRLLMPLYQTQGEDGFFLMEEIEGPDPSRRGRSAPWVSGSVRAVPA